MLQGAGTEKISLASGQCQRADPVQMPSTEERRDEVVPLFPQIRPVPLTCSPSELSKSVAKFIRLAEYLGVCASGLDVRGFSYALNVLCLS